ncbi:MAG: UDP-N-acetylmuramoyl-L-alanyl-D-glutamate--2,6-diaminopimelate ligase [Elusimicrobiales bacterium]
MRISELFLNTGAKPEIDCEVSGISINSKSVKKGYIFFALEGEKTNGLFFVEEAFKNGSVAAVVKKESKISGKNIIKVDDVNRTLALVSSRFYLDPSSKMKTVGITGTKGKTSTLFFLEQILNHAGYNCGVIGTINYKTHKRVIMDSPNTTPYPPLLDEVMKMFVEDGCEICLMEVSSHALKLKKVDAVKFDCAVFTNLQSDHLDFHITHNDYKKSKIRLFELIESSPKPKRYAVLNLDDPLSIEISKMLKNIDIISFSLSKKADIIACDIHTSENSTLFTLLFSGKKLRLKTEIIGTHNVYNILAASAAALSFGVDPKDIASSIPLLKPVKGRLERIRSSKGFTVYIDYAHTEKSLMEILNTLSSLPHRKIITVFGCGGDRDKTKRLPMGRVASEMSDFVIITSDNPRTEDPLEIIKDIEKGVRETKKNNYDIIPDRSIAIEKAISIACEKDIVLVAGKGHEEYQIINNERRYFSDRQEIENAMKKLNKL